MTQYSLKNTIDALASIFGKSSETEIANRGLSNLNVNKKYRINLKSHEISRSYQATSYNFMLLTLASLSLVGDYIYTSVSTGNILHEFVS